LGDIFILFSAFDLFKQYFYLSIVVKDRKKLKNIQIVMNIFWDSCDYLNVTLLKKKKKKKNYLKVKKKKIKNL